MSHRPESLTDGHDDLAGGAAAGDEPGTVLQSMAGQIPHLISMYLEVAHDDPDSTLGWCDDQTEFEFGLALILDGLDQMRDSR